MAKKKTAADGLEKVTVRVNDKVIKKNAAYGEDAKKHRAYHDPQRKVNPQPIGADPVEVYRTPFVNQRIKSGDLEEIRGGAAKPEK